MTRKDVVWIVNSLGELGVKVGDDFQFLYKGHSLRYEDPVNEEGGKPLMWRPVFKREFGECCHPVNYKDPTRWGTVSLDDSDEWKPLPASPEVSPQPFSVEDGYGNGWECPKGKPEGQCGLEVVRPGKVQCDKCDSQSGDEERK